MYGHVRSRRSGLQYCLELEMIKGFKSLEITLHWCCKDFYHVEILIFLVWSLSRHIITSPWAGPIIWSSHTIYAVYIYIERVYMHTYTVYLSIYIHIYRILYLSITFCVSACPAQHYENITGHITTVSSSINYGCIEYSYLSNEKGTSLAAEDQPQSIWSLH